MTASCTSLEYERGCYLPIEHTPRLLREGDRGVMPRIFTFDIRTADQSFNDQIEKDFPRTLLGAVAPKEAEPVAKEKREKGGCGVVHPQSGSHVEKFISVLKSA